MVSHGGIPSHMMMNPELNLRPLTIARYPREEEDYRPGSDTAPRNPAPGGGLHVIWQLMELLHVRQLCQIGVANGMALLELSQPLITFGALPILDDGLGLFCKILLRLRGLGHKLQDCRWDLAVRQLGNVTDLILPRPGNMLEGFRQQFGLLLADFFLAQKGLLFLSSGLNSLGEGGESLINLVVATVDRNDFTTFLCFLHRRLTVCEIQTTHSQFGHGGLLLAGKLFGVNFLMLLEELVLQVENKLPRSIPDEKLVDDHGLVLAGRASFR